MKLNPDIWQDQTNEKLFDHAIVIGGSIAGLTAARVLVDYAARVTIIERDRLPETAEFRRGVPQARHAHTLQPRGQALLEKMFPGLFDALLGQGAITVDVASQQATFTAGAWREPFHRSDVPLIYASRPLLESAIYQRLLGRPEVTVLQEREVVGLRVNENGTYVTGVYLRDRAEPGAAETALWADLVVDASGRRSKAPQWLSELGYTPPAESHVNAFPGYATRIYRRPADLAGDWKSMYILPTPPESTRGAVLLPLEGDRWHVTLVGMAGDYPPTTEEGFEAFARSLPSSRLYEALREAEPLTRPNGFRGAENRLRHYERLPHYLEGFLVLGDAVYTLNPVYAQGMTLAVMGSGALERVLKAHRRAGLVADVTGLAQHFQQALAKVVTPAWKVATKGDRQWPITEVTETVEATPETKATRIIARTPAKLAPGSRPLAEHNHAIAR